MKPPINLSFPQIEHCLYRIFQKKKFLKLSIWEIEKKWLNVFGQIKIIKTYMYFPY